MTLNNLVVLAYLRKSDEDKFGQVQSIEKQRDWALERAENEGDTIDHYFEDTRTAKEPGRLGFAEMMAFIEKSSVPVKLYAWKTSRLARNGIDEGAIKYAITRHKIAHIITRDRSYDESTNHILLGVDFGEATQFSIDLSKDVTEGLLQKVEKGYRPSIALNGWLNDLVGVKGDKKIYVDPERFPILQREAYKILESKGVYTVSESYRTLKAMGFRTKRGAFMAKSTLHDLFTNPFICAQYEWHGEWKMGKWKPMVTPSEFEKLQIYISGKRSRQRTHTNVYNGLIRCSECGCWVTTEPLKIKRQKNGNVHIYQYMRCTKSKGKCSQKCIRMEKLEQQITTTLSNLETEEGFHDFFSQKISRGFGLTNEDTAKQKELLQKRYNETETKISNITEKYALGKIDDDVYSAMIAQYKKERFQLESEIGLSRNRESEELGEFTRDMEFANIAHERFVTGSLSEKKEILGKLQSNLWLVDGNIVVDLKSSLAVLSQYNRLKSAIEPRKVTRRATKGVISCKWSTFSDVIRTYLKARIWMQTNGIHEN